MMNRHRMWLLALSAAALVSSCRDATAPESTDIRSSFEGTLDGWEVSATDVMVAGSEIPWHIQPATAYSSDGSYSLELHMANFTDAAKIWVGRRLKLAGTHKYKVTVTYDLASKDWGDANLFSLITGVLPAQPHTAADLQPTFVRSASGNGANSDVGYRWLHKEFSYTAETTSSGLLYVVVGIWGTFEVTRTYYIDALRVSAEPLP